VGAAGSAPSRTPSRGAPVTPGNGGGKEGECASLPPLSQREQSDPGVSGHRTHGPCQGVPISSTA
jgi:hypothetical protein